MKKYPLLFALLIASLFSRAQPTVALVGGLHQTLFTPQFLANADTVAKTTTNKIGVALGFTATVPLSNRSFFQTGVVYKTKNAENTQYYDTTNLYQKTVNFPESKQSKPYSVNTQLNLQYMDVPLTVGYRLSLKGSTSFVLGGGPLVSIFFNGTVRTHTLNVSQNAPEASSVRTSVKESENSDLLVGNSDGGFRVVHVGANAFAGFNFKNVYLHLSYNRDLTDFYAADTRHYKSAAIGFCFGIYLGRQTSKESDTKR